MISVKIIKENIITIIKRIIFIKKYVCFHILNIIIGMLLIPVRPIIRVFRRYFVHQFPNFAEILAYDFGPNGTLGRFVNFVADNYVQIIITIIKKINHICLYLLDLSIGKLSKSVRKITRDLHRELHMIFGQYYDRFANFVADNYYLNRFANFVADNYLNIEYYRILCYILEINDRQFDASYAYRVNGDHIRYKYVVITDGRSKYGSDIAKLMLDNGANVTIGVKLLTDGPYHQRRIRKLPLDITSLQSVRKFAIKVRELHLGKQIDILIINSCVLSNSNTREETEGYERHFFANYLGNLIMLYMFADHLKASQNARVVIESSACHVFGKIHFDDINFVNNYTTMKAYSQSKLANVLFVHRLAQLNLRTTKIYSVNPGYTESELEWCRNTGLPFIQNLLYKVFDRVCNRSQYSTGTTIFCALDPSVANESGYYYSNCQRVNIEVCDDVVQELWDRSCEMLDIRKQIFNFI